MGPASWSAARGRAFQHARAGALARDRLTLLDLAVAREKPSVGAQGGGGADDDGCAGRAPITRAVGHP